MTRDCVFVYFICEPEGRFVKIGTSSKPEFRLRELQTGNPRALEIAYLARFTDRRFAEQVEWRCHLMLTKHRCAGEWFCCDIEIAAGAVAKAAKYVRNRRGNVGYQRSIKWSRSLGVEAVH